MAPKTSKLPFYASTAILIALLISSVGLFISNETTIGKSNELNSAIAAKK
jgi:hypothetical protein